MEGVESSVGQLRKMSIHPLLCFSPMRTNATKPPKAGGPLMPLQLRVDVPWVEKKREREKPVFKINTH